MKIYKNIYEQIISLENLFSAWDAFKSDKRNRIDIQEYEWHLEENIFALHRDLRSGAYKHGLYKGFWIHDPKRRRIHKATVRDRVLHHAVFKILNPIFEPTFISTSFSCRVGLGTRRGVDFLAHAMRKMSRNYTKRCFVLKCDIRKFFDSVDHAALFRILERRIKDKEARWLLGEIIGSYASGFCEREREHSTPLAERNTNRKSHLAAVCEYLHE